MSGNLTHAPSTVVRKAIVDTSLGSLPSSSTDWPIHVHKEPDDPDNCITVFDIEPRDQGRTMHNEPRTEYFGIQVRVRVRKRGNQKPREVANGLTTLLNGLSVTIDSSVYSLNNVERISGPFSLGQNESGKFIVTINAVADITQTT